MVSAGTLIALLTFRLASYGIVGSPNNLAAMRALPEADVVMASGLFALIRGISGTIGPVISATFFDQRFFYHVQTYAADNDLNAIGLQEALHMTQQTLQWNGELAALLSVKTSALLQQRLLAEAITAAYQDYFFVAALIGVAGVIPAIPWDKVYRFIHAEWQAVKAKRMTSEPSALPQSTVKSAKK